MFSAIVLLDIINSIQVNEIPMVVCNSLILLFSIIHYFFKIRIKECEYLLIIVLFFHNAIQIYYYYGIKSLWFLIYLLQYSNRNKILKYLRIVNLLNLWQYYNIIYLFYMMVNYCIFILIYQIYNQKEQVSKINIAENKLLKISSNQQFLNYLVKNAMNSQKIPPLQLQLIVDYSKLNH
ncbi:unnamed protein product [Paramecium octaurelia]|uniref:Transmembrane protein n=1 Tax=Paramecium octaurelia TaxID=43137 RepID=A0A8S1XZ02_PAROT|nr:unnamed protein product [Paramecium octaurelia]